MITWSVFGVTVALAAGATALAVLNFGTPTPPGMSFGAKAFEVAAPSLLLPFAVVGVLLLRRQVANAVGRLLLFLGLAVVLMITLQQYGLYGSVTAPGAVPAARTVLWLAAWVWVIPTGLIPLLPLIFPTGRPISPRWWWVAAASAVGITAEALPDAILAPVRLPADGLLPADLLPPETLQATYAVGATIWGAAMVLAAASLVLRYRRARGDERLQLKWFLYASMWFTFVVVIASFLFVDPVIGGIVGAIALISFALIPVAIGIAILRYRLYDIDVVIERTLVYGSLSAVIAATYVAFVVTFQSFVGPHVGGSEVGIAGSTLLTLALVQPIRRRIQDTVDRRFYRSRYDAARTLSELSSRLRNEVDLDAVRADLISAINDTVRPRHASVWLRDITIGGK